MLLTMMDRLQLFFFLSAVSTVHGQACPDREVEYGGALVRSPDRKTETVEESWHDCAQRCSTTYGCIAWTWYTSGYEHYNHRKRCNLYSNLSSGPGTPIGVVEEGTGWRTEQMYAVSGMKSCTSGPTQRPQPVIRTTSIPGSEALDFTTTKWILPGTFPGLPPIKFVDIGSTLSISCATNDPTANVKLMVTDGNDVYVSAVKRGLGRVSVTSQVFTISKVTAADEGKYKCVAERGESSVELLKGALAVKVPEIRQIVPVLSNLPHPTDLKIEQNGRIEINCSVPVVEGTKRSYLNWYKSTANGDVIIDQSQIRAVRSTNEKGEEVDMLTLTVQGFQKDDIGRYVCKKEIPDGFTTFTEIWLFMKDFCLFQGELQPVRKYFVSPSCDGRCICRDSTRQQCVSLCPPHFVICPPGQLEVALPRKVSDSPLCSCKQKQCVNVTDHCYFEEKLYRRGDRFTSKKCDSCQCNGYNSVICKSLCPPKRAKCGFNEMQHHVVKEPSKGCFCKEPVCLKHNEVCKMSPEAGPCFALFRRWHYDVTTGSCKKFDYGGCQGNPNRFVKKEVCENTCNPKAVIKKTSPGIQSGNIIYNNIP